ncbi:DUF4097 family beta strand repeat-containing protein [Streptacidiphilus griseoplanus]|uniref:DUF4097 family beta strand repeat-containing protein n=1 Tax=Peterkaempfera griseoplana TaxID=66896 RepID=UPI0006E3D822|nr:DUF4097 family beta strand repeat-containing protein [Peterkaempfera griseoplana]
MPTTGTRTHHLLRPAAALLAAALLAAAATACSTDADSDPQPDHRSFALPGRTLVVESDNADLTLTPADGDRVQVERRIKVWKAGGGKPDISWSMSGDTLHLKVHCGWGLGSCSVHDLVQVPRGVTVTVHGINGDVDASGFTAPLSIVTTNGDISASASQGPLSLTSTNGDVSATGIRAAQTTAGATNGDVDLSFAQAPTGVRATSSQGDVSLHLPSAASPGYHLDLKSSLGDIVHDGTPDTPGSSHVITASSSTGDITLLRDGG